MERLDIKTKRLVISLIRKGWSLNKISSKLGINKTTIYYHMRKLLGKKIPSVNINYTDNERIGEIIGLFAGDGNIYDKKKYNYRIRFYFNKKEMKIIEYYKNSIKNLLSKEPREYTRDKENCTILEIKSKDFRDFILKYLGFRDNKTKTVHLKYINLIKDYYFRTGFLRGLIDSDGYIRRTRKEIYYGSISKNLIKDFEMSLDLFNINYKRYTQKRNGYEDFFKIRLSGVEVDKFTKIIKPIKSLNRWAGI